MGASIIITTIMRVFGGFGLILSSEAISTVRETEAKLVTKAGLSCYTCEATYNTARNQLMDGGDENCLENPEATELVECDSNAVACRTELEVDWYTTGDQGYTIKRAVSTMMTKLLTQTSATRVLTKESSTKIAMMTVPKAVAILALMFKKNSRTEVKRSVKFVFTLKKMTEESWAIKIAKTLINFRKLKMRENAQDGLALDATLELLSMKSMVNGFTK